MTHLERLGLLNILERVAEGIVAVVGSHCEIVIHDFSDLEHSAIAIFGKVSGRKPGAPVPDLEFISNDLDADTPDQLNYRIKIGSKELQSSTIWIRDDGGTPVGAVCINIDYDELKEISKMLDRLIAPAKKAPDLVVQDTWAKDVDELIKLSVTSYMRQEGIPNTEDLTQEDKLIMVDGMEKQGLFKIRGAATRLAEILNVTRASIYNYRASVKEKNSKIHLPSK
jgi:predicted transcriptional regulator YheO